MLGGVEHSTDSSDFLCCLKCCLLFVITSSLFCCFSCFQLPLLLVMVRVWLTTPLPPLLPQRRRSQRMGRWRRSGSKWDPRIGPPSLDRYLHLCYDSSCVSATSCQLSSLQSLLVDPSFQTFLSLSFLLPLLPLGIGVGWEWGDDDLGVD